MNTCRSLFLALGLIAIGCSTPLLSDTELTQYIMSDENGLIKSWESGDDRIEVVYSPSDLVMVRDLRALATDEERKEYLKAYDTISYFIMRLSHNGKEIENSFASNPSMFTSVVEYLGDGILADLSVVTESDTVPAIAVSYMRAFGTSNKTSLLCAFGEDLRDKKGTIKLIFSDSKLGTGTHEFVFKASSIKDIPLLKL